LGALEVNHRAFRQAGRGGFAGARHG
jgi:hypothetical protein